jgi:hypothetical protein
MGLFDTVSGRPAESGSTIHLEGKEEVSVVEVAYRQEAAGRIVEREPEENPPVTFTATLVSETANPDDPNAIAVQSEGRTVGHLSLQVGTVRLDSLRRIFVHGRA